MVLPDKSSQVEVQVTGGMGAAIGLEIIEIIVNSVGGEALFNLEKTLFLHHNPGYTTEELAACWEQGKEILHLINQRTRQITLNAKEEDDRG